MPSSIQEETTQETTLQQHFNLDDLTVLGTLGKGAFGEVTLVKHKSSAKFYALKRIAKERIRGDKHIQHVLNERNIMRELTARN